MRTHEPDGGGSNGPEPDRTLDIDLDHAPTGRRRPTRGGPMDVVYVLCLLQVAFGLLAALGEELLMGGNPLYLVLPVAKAVLLLVAGARAVSGRRWALVTLIVLSGLTLVAFWVQLALVVFPAIGLTVNLVGLATNVALPVAIIILCGQTLWRRSA